MTRFVSLILLLTLFVSASLGAQVEIPEVARSLMEGAERARDAGRTDEAIAKFQRVIEVAPSLASAYVNLGALYFKNGRVAEAHQTFVAGVENAPVDRVLLSNAAATAQQLGKSADALKYVDRALEMNRRDAGLFSLRSTILRSLQRNDEALVDQQQAVGLAPDDAKLHFSLGNLQYQLGKKEDAVAAYRKAVALDRTYLRAWYNLGAVLFESGRDEEALQAYRVALQPIDQSFARKEKVDPIHARAYANLGAIHLRQKQYEQAADAYQKALRLDPNDTAALYNLAFVDYSNGKFDRAEDEYRKALARDPSLPLAYLHLGQMAMRRGDAAKAIQILNDGMSRFDAPTRLIALRTLGKAQVAQGDRAGARVTYEEIARQAPDDPAALIHLTYERMIAARDAGDLATERAAIETLLAHSPSEALRAQHVIVLLRQGDVDRARGELALINDPAFAPVLNALSGRRDTAARNTPIARGNSGLLLWQLGRDAEARSDLAAAHTALPDWTEVTVALAETALDARKFEEAVDLLTDLKCAASPTAATVTGQTLNMTVGKSDDLCLRQKRVLAAALLSQAGEQLQSSPRRAKQLAERASALGLDPRGEAIALFIRGTTDLSIPDLNRAIAAGLPPALESSARKNLEAAQPVPDAPRPQTTAEPRRTVVVFLPDAPVENDRRLAEIVNAMVGQPATGAGVPLQIEFFRRAEDARAFLSTNRDRVGVLISNPEFITSDFTPGLQFTRDGKTTYRRMIVVPAKSSTRDVRGKTISVVDIFSAPAGANVVRVADDLTAIANVLFGKTDAAIVSEDNPLLLQRAAELRVISSSPAALPVVAFAAMPEKDRTALDSALHNARSAVGTLVAIEREMPRREVSYPPASAFTFRAPDPPTNVALRVAIELPKIDVPEPPLP